MWKTNITQYNLTTIKCVWCCSCANSAKCQEIEIREIDRKKDKETCLCRKHIVLHSHKHYYTLTQALLNTNITIKNEYMCVESQMRGKLLLEHCVCCNVHFQFAARERERREREEREKREREPLRAHYKEPFVCRVGIEEPNAISSVCLHPRFFFPPPLVLPTGNRF